MSYLIDLDYTTSYSSVDRQNICHIHLSLSNVRISEYRPLGTMSMAVLTDSTSPTENKKHKTTLMVIES